MFELLLVVLTCTYALFCVFTYTYAPFVRFFAEKAIRLCEWLFSVKFVPAEPTSCVKYADACEIACGSEMRFAREENEFHFTSCEAGYFTISEGNYFTFGNAEYFT